MVSPPDIAFFFFFLNLKEYIHNNILICKLDLPFSVPFFFNLEVIYFFPLWENFFAFSLTPVGSKYNLEMKSEIVLCYSV